VGKDAIAAEAFLCHAFEPMVSVRKHFFVGVAATRLPWGSGTWRSGRMRAKAPIGVAARYARPFALMLTILSGGGTGVPGAETTAPPSFDAFKVIVEHNIFANGPTRRLAGIEASPKPPPESLVLFGTMSFDKGTFAFFDGSNPAFKKELRLGDKIGDLVVTEIGLERVRLKAGELEFQLPVGSRLVREAGGQWKLGGTAPDTSSPGAPAAAPVKPPDAKPAVVLATAAKTSEATPEKSARWLEKKLSKHSGEVDPDYKAEKYARKMLEGSLEETPRKPGKPPKGG
jgi:hypothetical protein